MGSDCWDQHTGYCPTECGRTDAETRGRRADSALQGLRAVLLSGREHRRQRRPFCQTGGDGEQHEYGASRTAPATADSCEDQVVSALTI